MGPSVCMLKSEPLPDLHTELKSPYFSTYCFSFSTYCSHNAKFTIQEAELPFLVLLQWFLVAQQHWRIYWTLISVEENSMEGFLLFFGGGGTRIASWSLFARFTFQDYWYVFTVTGCLHFSSYFGIMCQAQLHILQVGNACFPPPPFETHSFLCYFGSI